MDIEGVEWYLTLIILLGIERITIFLADFARLQSIKQSMSVNNKHSFPPKLVLNPPKSNRH
jgi:hypothetical protein